MADLKLSMILDMANRTVRPIKQFIGDVKKVGKEVQRLARMNGLNKAVGKVVDSTKNLTKQFGTLTKVGLAGGGLFGFIFKRQFIDTAAEFERFKIQLTSIEGSSEKANKALAWIDNFTVNTPLKLQGVVESFVKLRTFGLDPMDGSMQAIVDMSEKLGGGQERLNGIVLALGQAWTKQKLQGEEALQLIERGVPVWDLLAKATGKTAPQLQELSSKGRLTRKSIKLLIDEMGKASKGSAARQMKTFAGMISNIGDQWTRFVRLVMDAGVFDFIKEKLALLLNQIDKLAQSGQLKVIAEVFAKKLLIAFKEIWKAGSALVSTINWLADTLGGYRNLIIGVAAIMAGPLLLAVAGFTKAITVLAVTALPLLIPVLKGIAAALLANPIMMVIAAIAAGAFLIIKNWSTVKQFWQDMVFHMSELIEKFMGKVQAAIDLAKQVKGFVFGNNDNPNSGLSSLKNTVETISTQQANVGGLIKVQIDSEGRPTIKEVRSNSNVDFDVDAGFMMAGP